MNPKTVIAAMLSLASSVFGGEPSFTTPKLVNLDKQIAARPDNAQAHSNRGYTLALLGRKEEARVDLKKAVELQSDAAMRNRVGWAYFNLGDYEEAVRHFEESAKMSGFGAHYDYYSLVLGYWGTKDIEKAMKNYQLATEKDPRLAEYKTLNERTAEWTPLERQAMHEIYVLWSKAWKL